MKLRSTTITIAAPNDEKTKDSKLDLIVMDQSHSILMKKMRMTLIIQPSRFAITKTQSLLLTPILTSAWKPGLKTELVETRAPWRRTM